MPVSAKQLFDWHERPGAFQRLAPPWENVTVLSHEGGIRDGAHVVLQVGAPPLSLEWTLVHQNYQAAVQFEDYQVRGPFEYWRHTHRFIPDGDNHCYLEDHIEYSLPVSPLTHAFCGTFVLAKLHRLFAYRHAVTLHDIELSQKFKGVLPMKIAITGASGLVGSALVPFLQTQGHDVVTLVRRMPQDKKQVYWDVGKKQLNPAALEGVEAVVHLAGENIADGRWTAEKKERIRSSRIDGTRLLCEALAKMDNPPKVLVCASAIGYYGSRGDETLTEDSMPGEGYLPEVCKAWEAATQPARDKGIRVVNLRFGVILTPKGGALAKMLPPFLVGAGGNLGSGKQYMSWIALDDVVGVILHTINTPQLQGAVNAVAPHPVTNAQFTKVLGKTLSRPVLAPVPAFAVKLVFGEMGDALLLSSAKVLPTRLADTDYHFRYPEIEGALRHLLGKEK